MANVDRGDTFEPTPSAEPEAAETEVLEPEVKEPAAQEPEQKEPEARVESKPETRERDDQGRFIPKGRFDEAVGKERSRAEAAERKLAELQASLQQVDRNADAEKLEGEIVALEKQHAKLLLDGDHEKAAELMTQIRLKERTIAIQQATHLSAQAKNEAREEVRMDAAIESLETTYAALNPEHEDFDQDLVDMVLATQSSLIQNERLTPSAALVKAAQKVMSKLGAKPAVVEEAKGLAAGKVAQDRKQAQVEANIDAARRQPASLKDSGIDSDKAGQTGKVDVTKLTREEFAALPEATKAKLRGDLI